METKTGDPTQRIQIATAKRIQKYQQLQGKEVGEFPFWDIVAIGAGDRTQKLALELQLQEKLALEQLPLGVDYCVIADPGAEKIGDGGSLLAILQCLKETYRDKLTTKKVLVMPTGGYSQRLPSASLLGKLFLDVPVGDPSLQMFDIKLALTIDYPAKMTAGIFLVAADAFELYDDEDSPEWSFSSPGVTALGHPSPLSIGTGHGVFLLPTRQGPSPSVEVVSALKFLHKQSEEMLRKEGALLPKEFCNGIGTDTDMVLTDSCYYMDFTTALKLRDLYYDESPLRCEIDGYGDILQPLGSQASTDYISNTANKTKVTANLTSMRHKIYDILQGTPLNVAVMQHSHFYHIGTTNEYLDHICNKTSLAKELGFLRYTPSDPEAHQSEPAKSPTGQEKVEWACVMNSVCPEGSQIHDRCVVEYSVFKSPVKVESNSIVSNCCIGAAPDGNLVKIPGSTFLYTACISNGTAKKEFVTVAFGIQDNMKKVVQANSIAELSIFGRSFEAICGTSLEQVEGLLFPQKTPRDLWHAKLFEPSSTMEDAFASTMDLVDKMTDASLWEPTASDWESRLSMADLIQSKDIFGLLDYKRKVLKDSKT
ncbi:fucose-1-phosphate guanylyltransferase-like [Asterias amurensis]|uniref:fucose-1-phosphate guanylyltransferase-like n=1 Tax=Asterias amurensis TaxID=7602 RepID=UPI003AB17569